MPKMVTANPRNVIGGHATGLIIGSLCFLIPHSTVINAALSCSLAVGLVIFLMVVTDTEHPPAAATALRIRHERLLVEYGAGAHLKHSRVVTWCTISSEIA